MTTKVIDSRWWPKVTQVRPSGRECLASRTASLPLKPAELVVARLKSRADERPQPCDEDKLRAAATGH